MFTSNALFLGFGRFDLVLRQACLVAKNDLKHVIFFCLSLKY